MIEGPTTEGLERAKRKAPSYREAGVDIEAGYEAVRRIRAHARSTYRPGVLGDIGSFGGFFEPDLSRYKNPVLVSGTDGVGTKLKIAFMMDVHDTVGIDLVAYCVNDILCQGAEPLFFLDYLAVGKLEPAKVEQIVKGIAEGCRRARCALVGGETAEMPGFYAENEYDMAGFAVGVVEKSSIIDGSRTRSGDLVVGIASTGLQSSGFSLVRRVLFEKAGLDVNLYVPEFGKTLGEELLTPTAIYVEPVLSLISSGIEIRGIANISGGGIFENLPRAMAPGTAARIDRGSWPVPEVFRFVQRMGELDEREMFDVFNMGIGMALIVAPADADACVRALHASLADQGLGAWIIGELVEVDAGRPPEVRLEC